jgi:hypothetical protein
VKRAFQDNAADKEQIRPSARREARFEERRLSNYRAMLGTVEGRAVFRDLLKKCRVYESIMQANAFIYYNAGRQDTGHELMAMLWQASPELYLVMEKEGRVELESLERELEAAEISRAQTKGADE